MRIVKCPKGHYYDGESFPSCPHCGENINTQERMFMTPNMDVGVGNFRPMRRSEVSEETVAYKETQKRVTGWMVAIDGIMYGDYVPLYEGDNLVSDMMIVFDGMRKKFYIDVGRSSTRIDLDSRTLSDNEYVYHHSRIRIHGITYVMVELCREGFDWNSKSVLDSGILKSADKSYDASSGKLKSTRWMCDVCGAYNNKEDTFCGGCGAKKQ